MDGFYIEDGFTEMKTLPPAAGLYPRVEVRYRPALAQKRHAYQRELTAGTVEKVTAFESDLIVAARVELNGEAVTEKRVGRLVPALRQKLIDLVLGYEGGDQPETALGN